MSKQFSIKLDEAVIHKFDNIHSGLGNSTKGETFTEIVEKYVDFSENPVNTGELTERLTGENQKLSEDFQKISEENRKLSEEYQQLSKENQSLKTDCEQLSNKDLEISRLTEENQKISEEYRQLSEENRKLTEKQFVFKPEIRALLDAACKLNDKTPAALLSLLFAAWMDYYFEPPVKRLKSEDVRAILEPFQKK